MCIYVTETAAFPEMMKLQTQLLVSAWIMLNPVLKHCRLTYRAFFSFDPGRSMQLQHISILRYQHSVRARRICICLSILSLTLKFGSFTSSAAPTYMESTDVASPTACKWLERTCCWQIISFTPAHTYFSLLRSTAPTYIVPTTPCKCFYWCSTCIESWTKLIALSSNTQRFP